MKIFVVCVLLFWPLVEPGVCTNPCDHPRICTMEYNPICGSNGVTYGNKCQFEGARECIGPSLTLVKYGKCEVPKECVDCRLVRMACTDQLRKERCNCNSREVCCDNCCGGRKCVPKKTASTCPDGSKPVNCFRRPCQSASCFAYPDATCVDNYCGGCKADWYVKGKLVDCNEVREECVDCRLVRMACTDQLRKERCNCNSREVCCNNCCGGQTCVPKKSASTCPDGSKPVKCFMRPCQSASCFAYPDATCVDNYCGGCNADWYVKGKLVDCKEVRKECVDCRLVLMLCTDELRNQRCSCNSREVCCNNCCGGQNCVPKKSECPDGSNPVHCFVRPCQVAKCKAYPKATCVDNYCGGCNTDWFVNGKLVDCNGKKQFIKG